MAISELLYLASTLVTGVLSVVLGAYVFRIDDPVLDIRGLIAYLLLTGAASFVFGLVVQAQEQATMVNLLNLTWTFVISGIFGYVHFGLSLSGNLDVLTWKIRLSVAGIALALLAAMWTDPALGRFRATVSLFTSPYRMVDVVYAPLGYLFVSFLLVLTGTGTYLVVMHLYRSGSTYRSQGFLVLLATSLPLVASALSLVDVPDPVINLTPPSAAFSAVLLAVAISRYGFLNVVPLAHDEIVENIDEYVLIAGPHDTVIDTNERASEIVTVRDPVGKPLQSVLPFEVPEQHGVGETVEREVAIQRAGRRQELALRSSSLTANDGRFVGRAITLRNVTELKARERELDLLKQVLTRVLRHNIRNSLIVIQSRAELISRSDDDNVREYAEDILETAENLDSTGQKARAIEQVLDTGGRSTELDLTATVSKHLAEFRQEYPAATWTLEAPDSCHVRTHPMFGMALRNVLENAVEHNDNAHPEIEITIEDGEPVELRIVDDGPGIPDHETAIIDSHEETPLTHASGVGLWLINWIVKKSTGSVTMAGDASGTTVVFEIEPVEEHERPASTE